MPKKTSLPPDEVKRRATAARQKYRDKHVVVYLRKDTVEHLEAIGGVGGANLRDTVDMLIHEYIYSEKGQQERARYEKLIENAKIEMPSTSTENSGAPARPLLDVTVSTPETMMCYTSVNSHLIKGDPQLLSRLAKKKKKKHKRDKLKASASVYDHFGVSGDASHVLACDMTPAAAAAAAWASGDRDMMASGDLMYDHSYWNVGPSSDELLKKKKRRERKRLKVKASAFVWDPHSGVAGNPLMGSGDLMYDETAWNVGSGSDEVSKNKRKRREPRKLKSSAFVVDELTGISGDRDMVSGDPSYGESGWNGGPAADGLPRSALEGGGEKLDGAAQSEAINVKIEPEDYDESEICKACCLKFPTPGDFIAHQQLGCVGEKHKDNDAHQQHGSVGRVHKDNEAHSSHSPEPSASQHEETDLQKIPERTEPVHSTQPLREPSASKQEDTDLQKIRERTEPVHSTQPLREPSTSKQEDTDLQKIPERTEPVHSTHPLREPSASKQEETDLQKKSDRTEPAKEGGDRGS